MKKIVMLMLVLASMSVKVNAQWFVTGTAGFGYLDDEFQFILKPGAGYEINDRWAVGMALGFGVFDGTGYGTIDPYARFNCWNNGRFFVDAKAEADVWFGHGNGLADIGFVPSVRVAINKNWAAFGDFGLIGAQCANDDWSPAFGFTCARVKMGIIYHF